MKISERRAGESNETLRENRGPEDAPGMILWRYRFIWTTIAVAAVSALLLLTPWNWFASWLASCYALLIALRSGWSMVKAIRSGTWGLDVLAVAAIVATVALGDYWASLVVVLMLTSGQALEAFAARRARSELQSLLSRAPRLAHVVRHNGTVDIAASEVIVGDRLVVKPGEVLPVDGILLTPASLDESSITGESLPVSHPEGAEVLSGAVNSDASLDLRATATAAESQYQTIVELVRSAADSKAPFVRLADRVAIPFTLGAFAIGALAWLVSGDPTRFAEVLVVATPCPLLIATPVAFISAMSRAANIGVIIKHGGALEQLARARSAAFDKTGTITRGTPRVDRIETTQGDDLSVLSLAAGLESESAHVLAKTIVDEARKRGLPIPEPENMAEHVACGVSGDVGGERVAAGKLSFAAPDATSPWAPLRSGETAVYVSRGRRLRGRIVLADEVRAESAVVMSGLREAGVEHIAILTGDAIETASKVASTVNVDDVRAALMPIDKVSAVHDMRPRPVMMVGDGVNDAPVLAAADVGVAMGARGATAASESADVVVLVEDLGRILDVVLLAKRALRVAYQSIGIGIGLSVALMLVASFGVLPAIVGAGLQEVVDVITILNALRAGRRLPTR